VLNHHWRQRVWRLRCVPVSFSLIQLGWQRQFKPPLTDGKLKPTLPAGLAESDQCFFALIAFKAWNTSWMMLLSFRGDRAISSDAATIQIQNAG
jgi:hypothetical protein